MDFEQVLEQTKTSFGKATDKILGWVDGLITMFPNLFVAVVIIVLFAFIGKYAKKGVSKLFQRSEEHSNTVIEILSANTAQYLMVSIGIFTALNILNLEKTVTTLLAGIGVLTLALALAFQEIVSNFVAGLILAFKKPFLIKHIIKIQDHMGVVIRTNLRTVVVKNFEGQEIYIPNRAFIQHPLINYSVNPQRRINLSARVGINEDLDKVEKQILKTMKEKVPGVIKKKDMLFIYTEFAESAITFEVRFWINYPNEASFLNMRTAAIKAIRSTFDQHDVAIPFPIRSLDFKMAEGEQVDSFK